MINDNGKIEAMGWVGTFQQHSNMVAVFRKSHISLNETNAVDFMQSTMKIWQINNERLSLN